MTRLPARRKAARSGIQRAPERMWPRHRKFFRSHGCCVPYCANSRIEIHHLRSAANAGTAIKPHDQYIVSLCDEHHAEFHTIGVETIQARYGIDLWALAEEFTRSSPDVEMRASLLRENEP